MVVLNLVLICFNNLLSFSVDKVTIGTYNFVLVILSVAFVGLLSPTTSRLASGLACHYTLFVTTQFSDHAKIKAFHN